LNVIWWVRRDLRIQDNPALEYARQVSQAAGGRVYPVFVRDPRLVRSAFTGPPRLAFLEGGLRALGLSLARIGLDLTILEGEPVEQLTRFFAERAAVEIVAEPDVSPFARRRDQQVAAALPLKFFGYPAVLAPGAVLKPGGDPYTVFTPFSKAWKIVLRESGQPAIPRDSLQSYTPPILPVSFHRSDFVPGEDQALARLRWFTQGNSPEIYQYGQARNRLDWDGTSALSPYLRFGMVAARRVVQCALEAIEHAPDVVARDGAETWLNELIWREFYIHILYHFPHVRGSSFRPALNAIRWENDPGSFGAWCEGRTGYPVVDAAMRQLRNTGWMHNRARMIVASFLTKDLLVDWRWGERWFMQCLLDGDPAANNGGWQWVAGTGTDAAPYFRIFNPVAQGMKFDPDGTFIRRWIPELERFPLEFLHSPWLAPPESQRAAGCRIGVDYPEPIVNHAAARTRVLSLYQAARQ